MAKGLLDTPHSLSLKSSKSSYWGNKLRKEMWDLSVYLKTTSSIKFFKKDCFHFTYIFSLQLHFSLFLYLRNILLPVIFVYFCFGLGITSSLGCSFPWISYEFKNCGGGKKVCLEGVGTSGRNFLKSLANCHYFELEVF